MSDAEDSRRRSEEALRRATRTEIGNERSQLINEAIYWQGRGAVNEAQNLHLVISSQPWPWARELDADVGLIDFGIDRLKPAC